MVSAGRELAPLRRVDHGVFTVAAGVPGLQHARSYRAPPGLDFAIECGPRLVVEGAPVQGLRRGVARRSALAYDGEGRVLLLATLGGVELAELAAFLARPLASGGLGARGALNLDGGSSTMFDLDRDGRRISIRSAIHVPVGVVVVPRAPAPGELAGRDAQPPPAQRAAQPARRR
jgi:uncharacterized protein YigE (DUF2233 family)